MDSAVGGGRPLDHLTQIPLCFTSKNGENGQIFYLSAKHSGGILLKNTFPLSALFALR